MGDLGVEWCPALALEVHTYTYVTGENSRFKTSIFQQPQYSVFNLVQCEEMSADVVRIRVPHPLDVLRRRRLRVLQ